MTARKFCVLSTVRCGSTAVCSLVRQHPDVVCHRELFSKRGIWVADRPQLDLPHSIADRDRDPVGFLAEIEGRSFEHAPVFGFKLLLGQNATVLSYVLASKAYRVVLLGRTNKLAQFSSLGIAQASGVWHTRRGRPLGEPFQIHFDEGQFRAFVAHVTTQNEAVRSELKFNNRTFFSLEYTDIANPRMVSDLLDFVGIDHGAAVMDFIRQNPQVKQNTTRIVDRFANPEDVLAAMREMNHEDWLGDECQSASGTWSTQ